MGSGIRGMTHENATCMTEGRMDPHHLWHTHHDTSNAANMTEGALQSSAVGSARCLQKLAMNLLPGGQ